MADNSGMYIILPCMKWNQCTNVAWYKFVTNVLNAPQMTLNNTTGSYAPYMYVTTGPMVPQSSRFHSMATSFWVNRNFGRSAPNNLKSHWTYYKYRDTPYITNLALRSTIAFIQNVIKLEQGYIQNISLQIFV